MNEVVIPPSPNWYNDSILVCSPDDHVIYASRKDIVVLKPKEPTEAAEFNIIHNAHKERVSSVNINGVSWGNPKKQIVSVGEDRIVNLWDFETLSFLMSHKSHENNSTNVVTAGFAGERIISVTENGQIAVWRITVNTVQTLSNIFGNKVKVMCMALCPHITYLSAFGLVSGLVVVADLRGTGRLLYRMRNHNHDITSLSWCPTAYNIFKTVSGVEFMESFKKKQNKPIKTKTVELPSEPTDTLQELAETSQESTSTQQKSIGTREEFTKILQGPSKNLQEPTQESLQTSQQPSEILKESSETQSFEITAETLQTPVKVIAEQTKTIDEPQKEAEKGNEVTVDDLDFELGEIQYPVRPRPTVDKKNPWGNIVFEDDDENNENKPDNQQMQEDFFRECMYLRKKIIDGKSCDEENEVIVSDSPKILENDHVDIKKDLKIDIVEKVSDLKIDMIDTKKEPTVIENRCIQSEYELNLSLPDMELSRDCLLASVCRAGEICIWRAGSDGRLEIALPKHFKTSHSNRKRDNKQNWITLCWAQPTLLLTSSIWHELLQWDLLPKPNQQKRFVHKSTLVHADHNRTIFSIAVRFQLYPDINEDWRTNKELFVWTNSADRSLLRTNVYNKKNESCYITYGGLVSAMTSSSLDPYKFAFASGDGIIRIWDFSKPHTQHIPMMCLFDKSHLKISSLDWHPSKDNIIAFGTTDGRVGEYDLNTRNKVPTIYSNYHRSSIYKCQWGPMPDEDEKFGIYSCALGEFIVHDAFRPHKEPQQISLFEDENVSNFSWKSDYTVLAVGTRTGSVKLVTKDLKHLQTLYMQKKTVRALEWHPIYYPYDSATTFSNYLAVCTNEYNVFVYDCTLNTEIKVIVLEGHVNGLRSVAWCSHVGGRLVSTCEDGIVIVWDVKTQTMLSTYNSIYENGPIVKWSPVDADLIITAGKILRLWRITKNPPKELPKSSHKKDKQSTRVAASETNGELNIVVKSKSKTATKDKDKKTSPSTVLCNTSKMQNTLGIEIARKLLCKLCNKSSNLTDDPLDETESELSDVEIFEDAKEDHDEYEISGDPSKLFTNRKDLISLLDYEQSSCLPKGRMFNHAMISLWKGTLQDTIKHCMENNKIEPWLINMAPMVSHKLWLELCEKYAHILIDHNNYLEASSYFLLSHKTDNAIEALCTGNFFREALCIVKLRLPEGASVEKIILEKWAAHSIANGSYEIAAQCYIKLGKLSEAAELLNNRTSLNSLELALEIARKIDNEDLVKTLDVKINDIKQKQEEREVKSDVINIFQSRFEAMILRSPPMISVEENIRSSEEVVPFEN